MINILVTGSKGQLGTEIEKISSKYPDFQFVFTDIEELDITNSDQVNSLFKHHNFNYCINCAAFTAVDLAEKEVDKARKLNRFAVRNLVQACENNKVFMVQLSTDYVFDGTNHTPYLETDTTCPVSVYGKTKLEGEEEVQKHASNYLIIRTSWLYSAHGHNFAKTIRRIAGEKETINVVDDQVGTPTSAADLARTILQMIQHSLKTKMSGIYHFSNEGVASWFDFASAIVEIEGSDCKVIPVGTDAYPTPTKRPAYSVLSKSKTRKDFGIEIPHWRESLKSVLKELSEK